MVLAHNINEGVRTKDIQITQDITFETMLLSQNTLNGLKASGFYKPSPIQLHAIPLGKCGFDLLLEAKSGTGKTAVFTVIALENIDLSIGLQVLILAPTREIAAQVCDVIKQIGQKFKGLCVEVVMGGLPIQEDIAKFKNNGVHIVVGSPGRLKHLIQEKYIELKSVRLFILDEADKLMEKSFLADIKYINSVLPKQKQVIMSSATYPDNCKEFINLFVHDAQHICPNSNCILLGVTQKVTFVNHNSNIVRQTANRFIELLRILSKKQFKQCLIFCNYQARVGEVHKMLTREKWPVEQLYGQQDQNDRLDALKTLQQYKCRLLVSTDLAARGIDASNVDLVINFEPPYDWQTYLHRIGRAGRFGSYGMAVTILSEGEEKKRFMNLLKPLSTSINLTTMWSEENLNDDATATDLQSKFSVKVYPAEANNMEENYFEQFWTHICSTNKPIELENFDNLVSSYNKIKQPEIESFSDLIASYQAIHLNDFENCLYKTIEISNPRFLSKTIQLLKNKTQHLQEISNYDVIHPSHCSEVISENVKATKGIILKSRHDINDNKINSFCSECKNNNLPLESKISHRSLKLKDDDNELLDLGLPTCFSSLKHKQQSDKKHSKRKQLVQNSLTNTSHSKGSKEYTKQSGISDCKSESIKEMMKTNLLSKHNLNKIKKKSKDSTFEPSSFITKQESNSKYISWYNRLKLQVKQIEQIIYIEELNKLC